MKFLSTIGIAMMMVLMGTFPASAVANDEHCKSGSTYKSLRQTVIIVDGAVIVSDTSDGPSKANQTWRSFALGFLDASNRQIAQLVAPRERVTLVVANADGSGLSILFSGCVPLWTPEEIEKAESENTSLSVFFGTDWRSKLTKAQESFRRSATLSMISGIKNLPLGRSDKKTDFLESSFLASIRRSPGFSLNDGLVRYVLLSDFSNTIVPNSDTVTARRIGKVHGVKSGVDFNQSDIHLFANGAGGNASVYHYLESFFLASNGSLITLGSTSSTITDNGIPVTNRVFQGTADFPGIGQVPVRMRLATDENNRVVMSWFQEQRREARAIPLHGALTCGADGKCRYQGDQIFAQIWSDNPNPQPECTSDMPMAGMRNLEFSLEGDVISGAASDTICVVVDRETEGLKFKLRELKGNRG